MTASFFKQPVPTTIEEIIDQIQGTIERGDPQFKVGGAGPLSSCGPTGVSFLDNPKYVSALEDTEAGFIITSPKYVSRIPDHIGVITSGEAYRSFASLLRLLYPEAVKPQSFFGVEGSVNHGAIVSDTASLEENVTVDPGVVIGPDVEIGADSLVCAGAKIGPGVKIGRNTVIGADVTISHALIGDNVIIHSGVRIGQDGFGFAMGPAGHLKVPQIGRVIIQDDVEIGANSTVDRGAMADTVIGAGTKIDNLVQIAHNVQIGRCCVIVSQVGISGSSVLEDFVVIGGKTGVSGHIKIGMGAQIAGASNVKDNVPSGAVWCGTPAQPIKDWMRQFRALKKLGT